ncbi:MAG: carboxypeptidase regulatory-like domain-containing protein [Deltaproteobacteria bacterium]|nr:carboxypeptidase regulatory-like domain-containing protein [Deltaproteobacteria bacterium]
MRVFLPILLLLAACSEPPRVQGTVRDVFGKPIPGATVLSDQEYVRATTDARGRFLMELPRSGPVRLMAGAQGYIKDVLSVEVPADGDPPSAEFRLWVLPEAYGFFGQGHGSLVRLEAARVEAVGSDFREIHGVRELTHNPLPASRAPTQFLFHSSRSEAELRQMEIRLHRLRYLERTTLPGPLGDQEIATGFWVPDRDVPFTLQGLQADDVFRVVTEGPLEKGSYAFEFQGVLCDTEPGSLARYPSEMQVVYPFEVK